MPIYDYRCPECNYKVEVLQTISDIEQNCPKCETAMIKQVSAVGRPVIK